jgi:hypothetical protein
MARNIFAHGSEYLGWERLLFIPLGRPGLDLLIDESGHHVFEHLLFFSQPEIHAELP